MMNEIQLNRTDLNLLPVFEAILAERHVGRAAERLHLTPSAVSHGLNRLRRMLNDPLFLKAPKGVVPTARAIELSEPIADVLARVRRVLGAAEPFDPKTSARRFTIGAPDGTAAVLLPPLLAQIRHAAPHIDISMRYLQHDDAYAELDARVFDFAVVPIGVVPARFVSKVVFDDELLIVSRADHPFARVPTLDGYCDALHILVSITGDPQSHVDAALADLGRSRRVVLTVPNFLLTLALISETDLISVMPESLVTTHGARFGVVGTKAPLPLRRFQLHAIAPRVAMMDAGVEWLFDLLRAVVAR